MQISLTFTKIEKTFEQIDKRNIGYIDFFLKQNKLKL